MGNGKGEMHKNTAIWTWVLWCELMDGTDTLFSGWPYVILISALSLSLLPGLSQSVALCCDVALNDHLPIWTNTHLSVYRSLSFKHTQTHSWWINDLMSNVSVSSVCYQCDSGQVLWHHQHLRRGTAWCNDRRYRNRHLQRVSIHEEKGKKNKCINSSKS